MTDHPLAANRARVDLGGKPVLADLSLDIAGGQITVIIGPNACGKSTLLRSFARLLPLASGRIVLDGNDIRRQKTRDVARRLGLLPQSPVAPGGITVRELAARGRTPHQAPFRPWSRADSRAVYEALDLTGMADLADRPVDTLSGGQRQRAWIALALAQETELLLLDEPTTYLDLPHQVEVLDLVRRLNAETGRTIVMVLHDINMAVRVADRMVGMKAGAIVADGPPETVVTAERIRELFGLDCVVISDPVRGRPMVVPA